MGVKVLRRNLISGYILCDAHSGFKLLTSHTNAILSILEGSSFTRPTYAKARAPKTPAEKAEVGENSRVVFVPAMAMISRWLFEAVGVYA